MKLTQALPAFLALAAAPLGSGLYLPTCEKQSNCLEFKVTEVETDKCKASGMKCEYEICAKTAFYKDGCTKPETDTVEHICKKKKHLCREAGGFGDATSFMQAAVPTRWEQCQHVAPGGVAEFIFKDGNGGCDGTSASVDIGGGVYMNCEGRPHSVPSCTDEAPGSECLWTATAPMDCPTYGGMGGDPHIMRWNGKRFSYHGGCDLVMIHSQEFGEGKGLDLHIRTTIDKFYSFVETMALKIGDDVLEINSEEVFFNQNQQQEGSLPAYISGYPISEEQDGANRVIRIDLHNGDRLEVKIYKKFLAVNVAARKADFGNSVGLLGDFHTGAMLARDGKTVIELDDEFGSEWQVQADEPKLFRDARSPQLPEETCRMPAISAARGLKQDDHDLKALAEEACSSKSPDAFDFCVFDVMATGDIGMAGAW